MNRKTCTYCRNKSVSFRSDKTMSTSRCTPVNTDQNCGNSCFPVLSLLPRPPQSPPLTAATDSNGTPPGTALPTGCVAVRPPPPRAPGSGSPSDRRRHSKSFENSTPLPLPSLSAPPIPPTHPLYFSTAPIIFACFSNGGTAWQIWFNEVSSPVPVVAPESSPFSTAHLTPKLIVRFLHTDLVHDPAVLTSFCFFRPLPSLRFSKNGSTAWGTRSERGILGREGERGLCWGCLRICELSLFTWLPPPVSCRI